MDKYYLTFYNFGLSERQHTFDRRQYEECLNQAYSLANFLTIYSEEFDLGKVRADEKNKHYEGEIRITATNFTSILCFLDMFSEYCGTVSNEEKDKYFVFGNSKYAFSNNPHLEWYVPELKSGFRNVNSAVDGIGDASRSHILKIQHCTEYELQRLVEYDEIKPSYIWTPFDNSNNAIDEAQIRKRFPELWSLRIEIKKKYVTELLSVVKNKLTSGSINSYIVCSDVDGMPVLIDPTNITAILPKANPWNLISADFVMTNHLVRIDLRSFVKEFSGFVLTEYRLPDSLIQQSVTEDKYSFSETLKSSREIMTAYRNHRSRK